MNAEATFVKVIVGVASQSASAVNSTAMGYQFAAQKANIIFAALSPNVTAVCDPSMFVITGTKTFYFIQSKYIGIPKVAVAAFNELCYICNLKKNQMTKPKKTPMDTNLICGQVQINMINVKNQQEGKYKCVGYIEDHIGNMYEIWSQKKKRRLKIFLFFYSFYFTYGI